MHDLAAEGPCGQVESGVKFNPTDIPGVMVIDIDPHEDVRGFFARTWCANEFSAHALAARMVQASISFNRRKGTLRGMHFQAAPQREARLVRCTAGATFDAVVDLRPDSPSFLRHVTAELRADLHNAIYVPPGCALGFQTLTDNTEVFYQMSEFYEPGASAGFRWNDPAFRIRWPDDERIVIERDANYPDFEPHLVQGFRGYL